MRTKFNNIREVVDYYDSISGKVYDVTFMKDETRVVRPIPAIPDVVELNRDMEHYVIKAASRRSEFFYDDYQPLTFVHFSDVHAMLELWNRVVGYVNHYSDYISFALHTGDYCGSNQGIFRDLYSEGTAPKRPFLNCIGNHDMLDENSKLAEKSVTYEKIFPSTDGWDVTYADIEYPMTYYKDFKGENIRLIVLDNFYDIEEQQKWLRNTLDDARKKGLHVITAMHFATAYISERVDTAFSTITDYESIASRKNAKTPFEDILSDFVKSGGNFVCNLAGDYHHDLFGYTEGGVLNVVVESASDWAMFTDGARTRGTRLYDCFNVVTVDTVLGIIKLVRIGDNVDHYLRSKRTLCYDYVNKKVIASN